jgi:ABC-type glycerol-3-phosphate transport system substrate-binding protein
MARTTIRLIFYWTLLLLIAGCTPSKKQSTEGTPAPQMAINLPALECSNPLCSDWTRRFIEEHLETFQYKYNDIKFVIIPEQSSGEEEAELIVNSIQSQNFPRAVVRFNNDVYLRVAAKLNNPNWHTEHLINFIEDPAFVAAHKPAAVDHILTQKAYSGFLPGCILEGRINCIWVNEALAHKIGVDLPGPEFSDVELLDTARKLDEYNRTHANKIYLLHGKTKGARVHKLFSSLYLSLLCDANGQLFHHDQRACENALKRTLEILNTIAVPKDEYIKDAANDEALFMNDQLLFYIGFTTDIARFSEQQNKAWLRNIKPLSLCTTGPFNYSSGYFSTLWAVLKNAPHSERASQFMQNLARPEVASEWTRKTKSATGIAGSLYDPSYSNDTLGQFVRHQNNKQNGAITPLESLLETQWPWGPCPQSSALRDIVLGLLDRKISPETAFLQLTEPE